MAKETEAGGIASRVTVRHLSSHERTPGVADVFLSGRHVGHVFYTPEFPVGFLPRNMHKLKLTAAELRESVAAAQEKARPLAEAEAKEQAELKALGV